MWIDRASWDKLTAELATLREGNRVLDNQNTALHATLEWFMVRTTSLEKERATIIERYMGITLETPNYIPAPARLAAGIPQNVPPMLGSAELFKDVGDAEANRLGIGWDANGNVVRQQ